jgi:ribosome maturation factor RimP
MTGRSQIAQIAFDLALPVVTLMGIDLVDAEYKKEGSAFFLRLFIDRRGGIFIEDCEKVSKAMDPIFDSELKVKPDFFEVSSPGLTRPLKTIEDYSRYCGEEVEITLYRPADLGKKFQGLITKVIDNEIVFSLDDKEITVPLTDISLAKRVIKF